MKRIIYFLEKKSMLSYAIVFLTAIFIFYISSKTFEPGFGSSIPLRSYIYHLGIFAFFNFFLLIALTKGNVKNKYFLVLIFLLSLAYAISDEIHQYFVPGRVCSYDDFLLDSIGILCSGIFYIFIKNY